MALASQAQEIHTAYFEGRANAYTGVAQDASGMIWFGTDQGVYSYDGFRFKALGDSIYPPRFVHSIDVAGDNVIGFCDQAGIHFFDAPTRTKMASPLDSIDTGEIRSFVTDGNLIFAGAEKLGVVSMNTDDFTWRVVNPRVRDTYGITSSGHYIYLATLSGLYRLDPSTDRLERLDPDRSYYSCLWDPQRSCLWAGYNGGIVQFNPQTNTLVPVYESDTFFKSLALMDDKLYAGTDNGLVEYHPGSGESHVHLHDMRNPYSLSNNVVWDVFVDRDHSLWMATGHGASTMSSSPRYEITHLLSLIQRIPNIHNPQSGNISSLIRDSNGDIWLGGTNGLVRIMPGGIIQWYRNEYPARQIPHNNIRRLYQDPWDNLWAASDHGVLWWDRDAEQWRSLDITDGKNHAWWPYDILATGDGNVWVATYASGVFKFARPTAAQLRGGHIEAQQVFSQESPLLYTLGIKSDPRGLIWLAHRDGAYLWDPSQRRLCTVPLKTASGQEGKVFPLGMHIDIQGKMWYATDNAIGCYNPATSECQIITTPLLSTEPIRAIMRHGNTLYVLAPQSLCAYDTAKGTWARYTLPPGDFSSIFYDQLTNDLMLGGYDVLMKFDPQKTEDQNTYGDIRVVGLSCNNEPVAIQKYEKGDDLRTFVFPSGTTAITLEVSNFAYSHHDEYTFSYQLIHDGKEGPWITLPEGDNRIALHQLPAGAYQLRLCSSLLPDQITTYAIAIRPPWYLNAWMKLLYLVLAILVIALIVKVMLDRNRRRYEQLERQKSLDLSQMKIDFFTNISHDLKTPLSLILGPVDTLLERQFPTDNDRSLLESIRNNAQRLNTLIKRVLDFKQVDFQEEQTLVRSQVEINRLVKSVADSFAQTASKRNITIAVEEMPQPLEMNLDLFKMESVFYNVMSNAVKFVPDSDGRINVRVALHGNHVRVTVADNGIGIPKEDLNLVWIRLYQARNSSGGNYEGSGIGLALVKKFVELHNGTVDIAPNPDGKGTMVTIDLPLEGDNVTASNGVAELPAKADDPRDMILLIDDNSELLQFLHSALSLTYRCRRATDGREGLEKAQQETPSLIIVDEMMPVMSGLEFCKRIKGIPHLASVPIIMLTAHDDPETENRSIQLGVDAFMSKPFDVSRLKLRIAQLLDARTRVAARTRQEVRIDAAAEPPEEASSDERLMEDVLQLIEKRMGDASFNVSQLCEELGIGQKRLLRMLKATQGTTPVNFLRSLRLKRAAALLRGGKFTVSEVMYMVGFTHPSYFARAFTEEFGVSPRDYASQTPQ